MLLRVNARNWIDTSSQVASDAVLVESLDQATRGPADLALVHKTVQDRLRYFNDSMKVDLVLATDARGRVIARVGTDATVYKDGIEGYPLVADALRGLRGDDTWSMGGKLFRVAASPVLLRDRYVGTVVIGQEATSELAESMKKMLGTDVVLLLKGRVIASTAALPILDRLPMAASSRVAELERSSRTAPFTLDSFAVVFGSFAGDAADHRALFALCSPRRSALKLPAMLLGLARRDPRTLPLRTLSLIGGITFGLLIVGFLLAGMGAGPMGRLVRDSRALSRGEIEKLPEKAYGGRFASVVNAINSTIERITSRGRASERLGSSKQSLLGDDPATTPLLPQPAVPVIAAVVATAPSLPAKAAQNPAPTTRPLSVPKPALPDEEEVQTKDREEWSQVPPVERRGLFTHTHTPLPPPIMADDSEPIPQMKNQSIEGLRSMPADGGFSDPNTIVAPSPAVARPPIPQPPMMETRPELRAETQTESRPGNRSFDEPTSVESPSEALLIASANETNDEIEAGFRQVFDEFVLTRQNCGESMEGVTIDKFVVKLRQNRAQLIQRYGCSSVRFQVYVREGKTALKATPIP